ncbi:hypothetical protein WI642_01790, partial [Vibrio cholerae]
HRSKITRGIHDHRVTRSHRARHHLSPRCRQLQHADLVKATANAPLKTTAAACRAVPRRETADSMGYPGLAFGRPVSAGGTQRDRLPAAPDLLRERNIYSLQTTARAMGSDGHHQLQAVVAGRPVEVMRIAESIASQAARRTDVHRQKAEDGLVADHRQPQRPNITVSAVQHHRRASVKPVACYQYHRALRPESVAKRFVILQFPLKLPHPGSSFHLYDHKHNLKNRPAVTASETLKSPQAGPAIFVSS